jgi:sugar/nucleoside kinase (ribokinase family)
MPVSVAHDAVVAGHICLDLTPRFPETASGDVGSLLAPGKLVAMDGIEISTGGAVSNTGIALSVMGAQTILMCKVGADGFGSIVRNLVRGYGSDSGVNTVDGAATSYTVILAPPGTDRIFLHDPGANDTFEARDIDYDLVARGRLFHFGYPPVMRRMYEKDGDELAEIFSRVKSSGVTTSLDMAMPGLDSPAGRANWRRILEKVLPHVDIFLPSLEEILLMLDRKRYTEINKVLGGHEIFDVIDLSLAESLSAELLDMGVRIAGIKCGKLGIHVHTGGATEIGGMGAAAPANVDEWAGRNLFAPAFSVAGVKSATGAGDSSIAGFLAALLRGDSVDRAVDMACLAGARTVQVYDALSGVVSMEEMASELASGPARVEIPSVPESWKHVEATGHWALG